MIGIEQGDLGERFPHGSGVTVTLMRDAIGGRLPVDAKRVKFWSATLLKSSNTRSAFNSSLIRANSRSFAANMILLRS